MFTHSRTSSLRSLLRRLDEIVRFPTAGQGERRPWVRGWCVHGQKLISRTSTRSSMRHSEKKIYKCKQRKFSKKSGATDFLRLIAGPTINLDKMFGPRLKGELLLIIIFEKLNSQLQSSRFPEKKTNATKLTFISHTN